MPAVLDRDRHACVMCGRPCPHEPNGTGHHHVDHIERRSEGNSDDISNLRTVCRSFNLRGACE